MARTVPTQSSLFAHSAEKVEGEAQGDEAAITAFLKDVDKGPSGSHVVKLDKEERDLVVDESGFHVRH